MNKYFKNFVLAFSILTLCFYSFAPKRVNAVALVDDLVVVGGVTVSASAILGLVGSTLVAGGVVLDATLNDGDVSKYIVNKMVSSGEYLNNLSVKTVEGGKQFLTWTKQGINWLSDTYKADIFNPVISADYNSITLSSTWDSWSGEVGNSATWSKTTPIGTFVPSKNGDIKFYINGSFATVKSIYAGYTYTLVLSQNYDGKKFSVQLWRNDYDYYLAHSGVATAPNTISWKIDYSSLTLGDSVCPTPSDSLKEWDYGKAQDVIGGSLDGDTYTPSIGIPLVNSDNVYNPSIDFPYSKTWDTLFPDISISADKPNVGNPDISVPDVSVPDVNVGDTTGSIVDGLLNIPILGDILKILVSILNLLKSFITSLMDVLSKILDWALGLVQALLDGIVGLFVPKGDFFVDNFNKYREMLLSKLQGNDLTFLNGGKPSKIEDLYINVYGNQVCVLRFSLFEKFRGISDMLIRGVFYFLILLFNYNQIIKFLRGSIFTDYNSRSEVATLQGDLNKRRLGK